MRNRYKVVKFTGKLWSVVDTHSGNEEVGVYGFLWVARNEAARLNEIPGRPTVAPSMNDLTWNAAIEAAARVADDWATASKIRALRKSRI